MAPHITHELAGVDAALDRWAQWARNPLPGWPEESLLGRIVRYGPGGASQGSTAIRVTEVSQMAERVDSAIAELPEPQQLVIHKHYRAWEPIKASAERLEMSPERFRVLLHRARHTLKESLDL